MFNRSRITDLNPESYGRKNLIERRMLNGNRRTFHIFMLNLEKKARNWLRKFSGKLKRTAWKDISPEEAEAFMAVYHKIYKNLSEAGCEHTGKEGSNK